MAKKRVRKLTEQQYNEYIAALKGEGERGGANAASGERGESEARGHSGVEGEARGGGSGR